MTENILYENVQNDIKRKIESGIYHEGDKLESEDTLCKMYNVSKVTLRKALSNLINEKYLQSRPRVGYFVAKAKTDVFTVSFDVLKCIDDIVTDIQIESVDSCSVNGFGKEKVNMLCISRLYICENENVAYEKTYVKHKHAESYNVQNISEGYYDLLIQQMKKFSLKKELYIEALGADGVLSEKLECFQGDPVLKLSEKYYDKYEKDYAETQIYILGEKAVLKAFNKSNLK